MAKKSSKNKKVAKKKATKKVAVKKTTKKVNKTSNKNNNKNFKKIEQNKIISKDSFNKIDFVMKENYLKFKKKKY